MRAPRRLSSEEAAMWRKVAATVTPMDRRKRAASLPDAGAPPSVPEGPPVKAVRASGMQPKVAAAVPAAPTPRLAPPRPGEHRLGLDGSWERRVAKGTLEPDFSLDLHGATLDQAYMRLLRGLAQARAMDARVVLVVTGKPRPAEAADRGRARGAIRAKIVDWLAASEHAGDIAAIRGAHRRHGGQGAVYIVLKRRRA